MDKDKMISIINDAFETSTASGGYYIKGPEYYKNKGGHRNILWITVSKNRISIYCNPMVGTNIADKTTAIWNVVDMLNRLLLGI